MSSWRGSLLPLECEALTRMGLLRSPAEASALATMIQANVE